VLDCLELSTFIMLDGYI